MTPVAPASVRPTPATAPSGPSSRPADSPEDAARQFESVLVRQFVEVMTRDLFKAGGKGGMLTGQADLQRDTLTNVLTDHLVDSGTFGVADLMIRQWARTGRVPADPSATPSPDLQGEGQRAVPATPAVPPPLAAPPDVQPLVFPTLAPDLP